jgi:hypothetical protein
MMELKKGHKWCHHPKELEEFKTFIQNCETYATVETRLDGNVELFYEQAG